jgi:hypothetical protein
VVGAVSYHKLGFLQKEVIKLLKEVGINCGEVPQETSFGQLYPTCEY